MDNEIDDLIGSFEEVEFVSHFKSNPSLLLHPNVPKPLHGMAPRTLMSGKEWDVTRRGCYKDAEYKCEACGIQAGWDVEGNKFGWSDQYNGTLKLHAHEDYDIDYEMKEVVLNKIVSVCATCHNYIHSGRTQSLYEKGILDEQDMWEITTNGDSVLIDGGISPSLKEVDKNTYEDEWDDWRLLFRDKIHSSKFKDYDEWVKHYKGEDD